MRQDYEAGAQHVFRLLNVKQANMLQRVGSGMRNLMIGEKGAIPKAWNQIRSGKAFRSGGVYHKELNSPGNMLMQVGLPAAMGAYEVSQAPAGSRAETLGSAVGNTVGGFLGMPGGMVGSSILGGAGGALGSGVGRMFGGRSAATPSPALRPSPYSGGAAYT